MNEREAEDRVSVAQSPSRRLDQLGLGVAAAATIWFALAAARELTGPFDAGHDAATAGVGIAATEMWRWGSIAPVLRFLTEPPTNADYYCHHPWGVFWTTAVLVKLLGHHDWVLRLAPVTMSAATPPLIFLGARRLWGVPAAGLATVAFTVTPLAVAFADFNALEVPVMFGLALAIWALIRFRETWRRRDLGLALLGLAHALNTDWPAFVFAGTILALGFVRGTVFANRWYQPIDQRRYWLGWASLSGLAVLVLGFYVVAFHRFGQLEQLLRQAEARSAGVEVPLAEVLEARRHWIELGFTPIGVALGKVAVPVLVARATWLKRDLEALPLAVLVMAVFQYLVFKQGADVHVFWPQYFSLYLAYAVGALAASSTGLLEWLFRRWAKTVPRVQTTLFVLCALPLALMLPDAVATLGYARRTGKRFDDGWRLIHQDADKNAVARQFRSRLPEGVTVAVHSGMKHSWALEWALARPVQVVRYLPQTGTPLLLDSRFADAEFLLAVARSATVTAYGPFWLAEVTPNPGALRGYRLVGVEPTAWEWYFVDAHDPRFEFAPDPAVTWELRYHLGLRPNPDPELVADDTESLRVAHNVAVAHGRFEEAGRLLRRLSGRLHPISARGHAAGLTLLGWEWHASVAPRLRLYVAAVGPTTHPWQARVTSRVLERGWSTVPAPDAIREVGMPFAIPSSLFVPGFVYVAESEIREQPGIERYRVQLRGPDGAGDVIPLFDL